MLIPWRVCFFPGDSPKSTFGFPCAVASFWCPAGERHLLVHVGRGAGGVILQAVFMNCERKNMVDAFINPFFHLFF